jgi:hypothetical protein
MQCNERLFYRGWLRGGILLLFGLMFETHCASVGEGIIKKIGECVPIE